MTEHRTFPEQSAPEENWLTSPPPPPPGAGPADPRPADARPTDARPTDARPTGPAPSPAGLPDAQPTGARPADPTVIVPPDPTRTVPTATGTVGTGTVGTGPTDMGPIDKSPRGPAGPVPGFRQVLVQRAEQLRQGLDGASPGWLWLAGGASVVAAYALAWLVALIETVRHQPGLTAQGRLLTLLGPGDVTWAAVGLFGVALVAAGRRLDRDAVSGRQAVMAFTGLLIMAATILGAALLGVLVELANLGNGIDAALAGIVARIAVLPVAGVAAAWAWHALGHHRS